MCMYIHVAENVARLSFDVRHRSLGPRRIRRSRSGSGGVSECRSIPVMVKLAGVITRNNPSCSAVSVICCFPPFCFGDVLRERCSACLERVLLPVVDILECSSGA